MTPQSPDDLIATFDMLGDWEERYAHLLDLGKQLGTYPDALRDEPHKVRGCMSQVWLATETGRDGRMHFLGDSDAHIVRGLVALLLSLVEDRTPAEVLAADVPGTFAQLGLDSHLSLNRRNGVSAMVGRVRAAAEAAQAYAGGGVAPAPALPPTPAPSD